jgi:hypothetical protein
LNEVEINQNDVKSFEEIYKEEKKIIVITDESNQRTTSLYYALKLKRMFPSMWIQRIDIKQLKFSKNLTVSDEKDLLKYFFSLDNFERDFFQAVFKLGKVIFLWDGFDEKFAQNTNFALNLIKIVKNQSENFQFLFTSEHYTSNLRNELNATFYKFIPLSIYESFEYLTKYVVYKKIGKHENDFWDGFKYFIDSPTSEFKLAQKLSLQLSLNENLVHETVKIISKGIQNIRIKINLQVNLTICKSNNASIPINPSYFYKFENIQLNITTLKRIADDLMQE